MRKKETVLKPSDYAIRSWKQEEAKAIYEQLEHPGWAPWLEASVDTIVGRAQVFPMGQVLLQATSLGEPLMASVSTNQINWDGKRTTLPNWDTVAGDPTTYEHTYVPDGNTLVLMSMNVAPAYRGMKLPFLLVEELNKRAKGLHIEYLIGSFRPSGYGEAKRGMGYGLDFTEYCWLTHQETQRPLDPWLRSLSWAGMKLMAPDYHAMTVTVPMTEFLWYQKSYKPDWWKKVAPDVWECGEVGRWAVDSEQGCAIYKEANVWGSLPLW